MSDDNNGRFNLSRRKALAGLGGIGLAAGAGGFATTALYRDTESTDVTVTAGNLNLEVDAKVFVSHHYDDGQTVVEESSPLVDIHPTDPPSDTLAIAISDLKPGDCLCVLLSAHLEGNPSWVWATCEVDSTSDGQNFEPEKEVDSDWNTENAEGELDDKLDFQHTALPAADDYTSCPDSFQSSAVEGKLADASPAYTPFDGDDGTSTNSDGQPIIEPVTAQQTHWIAYRLCLPVESGNVTMGDDVAISCTFQAEQARNNPLPSAVEGEFSAQAADYEYNNTHVDNSPSDTPSS